MQTQAPLNLTTFLDTLTVNDIAKRKLTQKVVEVEANTSINDTLQTLKKHNILSVPVLDKDSGTYIGFVDVLDILSFILQMYTQDLDKKEITWGQWMQDMETLTHRGVRFGLKPIKQIINKSHTDKFVPVYAHGTLYQLAETLSRNIHRVPLMSETKNLIKHVVSQSDLVRVLADNLHIMGDYAFQTVEQLSLGNPNVITMSIDAPAITAFYLLYVNHVSAIALCNSSGAIVATLSASDIRGFEPSNFSGMMDSCKTYLEKRYGEIKQPLVCCNEATLEHVILKLGFNNVHRLWVVNEDEVPVGVISLTDIMRAITNTQG